MAAFLHLIHGRVGAGKTTFARKLEERTGAVRFTVDEWMVALYGRNPEAGFYADYETRCKCLIWSCSERLLNLGIDVILDFGFWHRAERDDARARAKSLGVTVKLYEVCCPPALAAARVLNRSRSEDHLQIDEAAIEKFNQIFEPLHPSEERQCVAQSEAEP